jgi:hypothetical protein
MIAVLQVLSAASGGFLLAHAQVTPTVIFENFDLLPAANWATQGYSDAAYTNSGCDDQTAPQNGQGAMTALAVRLFLPNTSNFNSVWSITKLRMPLKCTSVATATTLGNYRLNFYADNGVAQPTTTAGFNALQIALLNAANPNSLLPMPGQLVRRAAALLASSYLMLMLDWHPASCALLSAAAFQRRL